MNENELRQSYVSIFYIILLSFNIVLHVTKIEQNPAVKLNIETSQSFELGFDEWEKAFRGRETGDMAATWAEMNEVIAVR